MEIISPLPKAQLRIHRTLFSDTTSIGDLFLKSQNFCFTLEDTVRHGPDGILQPEEKIPDRTAIPTGIFELELDVSSRFGFCPFILNVPLFSDTRIHWGNKSIDTRGCILVGKTKGIDFIGESRTAFKELMMELVPMRRLERIYLEVLGGPSTEDLLRRAA